MITITPNVKLVFGNSQKLSIPQGIVIDAHRDSVPAVILMMLMSAFNAGMEPCLLMESVLYVQITVLIAIRMRTLLNWNVTCATPDTS